MRPDDAPPGASQPPGQHTALQARHPTDLSTFVLSPAGATVADEGLNFRELWHVVLKRKWAVIAIFLIAVITTAIATMLITPIYRAVISLQIEREPLRVVEYKDVTPEQARDADFYRTQYELLKSRTLAERVVQQLNLRQQPAAEVATDARPPWLTFFHSIAGEQTAAPAAEPASATVRAFLASLTVAPVRNSRLVKVYFDSPDPKLAADALNALAQNFITTNLERRFDASSYAKTFLEERIAQTKTKLEEAERALVHYQRTQQIVNIDEKQNVLSQSLGEFNAGATRAQQERIRAETLYREFNSRPELSPQVTDNKMIQTLKEQRIKLAADYEDELRRHTPAHPAGKIKQLKAKIDELDQAIKAEIESIRASAEAAYRVAVAQEGQILARLDTAKKEMLDQQGRSIEYSILKREVDTNRQFYDGLLQRLKEVGVSGGIGVNNISVVDSAQMPSVPYKPDMQRNLLMAIVLGLMGGIALAFFLEYLDDRLHRPDEMERVTHLPVLGVVPLIKAPRKNKSSWILALEAHNNVRSSFAEAYRSVRTALQFSTREGAPRQFVVTSTAKGDGKSTSALSLAINFAQTGRPVLLIDADLRNPALHKQLDVDTSEGLSNYLSSDLQAENFVRPTSVPNLFLMPAGPLPPNPVELLSGPKLRRLLAELGEQYSQIIVDAPPVLGIADAIVLGNQVGAVLFVIAAGGTKKAQCKAALKRLRQGGVQPVGALMTKVNVRGGMYGYESAYYYYGATDDSRALPST